MKVLDLPLDITEEILSRLPITSMREIRLTCKTWNTLSKTQSFAEKHVGRTTAEHELRFSIMIYSKIYMFSLKIHNNLMKPQGKLILRNQVSNIYDIVQCDGLLLFPNNYCHKELVVWNPYWGQKRCIKPKNSYNVDDMYTVGFEEKKNRSRSHKILWVLDCFALYERKVQISEYVVYDLESDSWSYYDMTTPPDWVVEPYYHYGVSIKGNRYWVAEEKLKKHVLISFDFTSERFGPCLHFPFQADSYVQELVKEYISDYISLSSVRETQLVVLLQRLDMLQDMVSMEIWITSEITPKTVVWNKLWLAVDISPLDKDPFFFPARCGSFFIDEDKKVAVFIGEAGNPGGARMEAWIIGVDGCLGQVDLRIQTPGSEYRDKRCPLVTSYVPSCVPIQKVTDDYVK